MWRRSWCVRPVYGSNCTVVMVPWLSEGSLRTTRKCVTHGFPPSGVSITPLSPSSRGNSPQMMAVYCFLTSRCSKAAFRATTASFVLPMARHPDVAASSRCTGCGVVRPSASASSTIPSTCPKSRVSIPAGLMHTSSAPSSRTTTGLLCASASADSAVATWAPSWAALTCIASRPTVAYSFGLRRLFELADAAADSRSRFMAAHSSHRSRRLWSCCWRGGPAGGGAAAAVAAAAPLSKGSWPPAACSGSGRAVATSLVRSCGAAGRPAAAAAAADGFIVMLGGLRRRKSLSRCARDDEYNVSETLHFHRLCSTWSTYS